MQLQFARSWEREESRGWTGCHSGTLQPCKRVLISPVWPFLVPPSTLKALQRAPGYSTTPGALWSYTLVPHTLLTRPGVQTLTCVCFPLHCYAVVGSRMHCVRNISSSMIKWIYYLLAWHSGDKCARIVYWVSQLLLTPEYSRGWKEVLSYSIAFVLRIEPVNNSS